MAALDHRLLQQHGFAVMDPLVVERAQWPDCPTHALAPPPLASRAHLLPSLLDLRVLDADRIGRLAHAAAVRDKGNAPPLFSALVSAADEGAVLARRLGLRFVIREAGSSARSLLRWHDPRVFEQLPRILPPPRLAHLLQPVRGWSWRNRGRQWVTTRVDPDIVRASTVHLDADTWRKLGRVAVVNRIIDDAASQLPAGPEAANPSQLADAAWRLLNQAHDQHGLTDDADCRLFVLQALAHGTGFHLQPSVARCIERARAGQASYVGACASLSRSPAEAPHASHTFARTQPHGL